jgi:hypothetical protein
MVKKKESAVGGSARKELVVKGYNKQEINCFSLIPCLGAKENSKKNVLAPASTGEGTVITTAVISSQWSWNSQSSKGSSSAATTAGKSQYVSKTSSLTTQGPPKKGVYYALKSMHLDRCSTKQYKDELKNEVEILCRCH